MIGLSGPHRSGKTTLAKACNKEYEISFVPSQASKVVADMGFDQKTDYDIDTRLHIQRGILAAAEESYRAMSEPFITDRTPIDFIAYTLCDAGRKGVTPEQSAELENFIEQCYWVASRYFKTIIYVPATIKFVAEDGKPPENYGYQEHIGTLIQGAVYDERLKCDVDRIYRRETNLKERMESIGFIYQDAINGITKDIKQAILQ